MKTNKKVQFAKLAPLMLSVHKGESKLVKALVVMKLEHPDMEDKEFAEQYIAWGESLDYTTRWLGDILRMAGIKRRKAKEGGTLGRKPASPAEKKSKQADAFKVWLATMPDGLTKQQAKAVAAKLAKVAKA